MNRFRPTGVWGFILRRLLLGIVVLILVSILVFLATQALPGDPARAILGRSATPASLAALRRQLHLDQPVFTQYWTWITGLLRPYGPCRLTSTWTGILNVTVRLGPSAQGSKGAGSVEPRFRSGLSQGVTGADPSGARRPQPVHRLCRTGGRVSCRPAGTRS